MRGLSILYLTASPGGLPLEKEPTMSIVRATLAAALLSTLAGRLTAQEAVVTPLMTKELADLPARKA